jgi:hypothetical protein
LATPVWPTSAELEKLDVPQQAQGLSCKTGHNHLQRHQRPTGEKQNPQPLDLVAQRDAVAGLAARRAKVDAIVRKVAQIMSDIEDLTADNIDTFTIPDLQATPSDAPRYGEHQR